jgi:urease accessory protein
MLCEKILGSAFEFPGKDVDYIDIEWYETHRRLHRKLSRGGVDVGIRLDGEALSRGIRQDDVLGAGEDSVIAANILPCDVLLICVDESFPRLAEKVCYEIGNRHSHLFWGDGERQFVAPYDSALEAALRKLRGVIVKKETRVLDFSQAISSGVYSHEH